MTAVELSVAVAHLRREVVWLEAAAIEDPVDARSYLRDVPQKRAVAALLEAIAAWRDDLTEEFTTSTDIYLLQHAHAVAAVVVPQTERSK